MASKRVHKFLELSMTLTRDFWIVGRTEKRDKSFIAFAFVLLTIETNWCFDLSQYI